MSGRHVGGLWTSECYECCTDTAEKRDRRSVRKSVFELLIDGLLINVAISCIVLDPSFS